jgi:hypothetical protein
MNHVYQSLNKEEKIRIFEKCQQFLVSNYPDSEFIVRKSFLKNRNNKFLMTLINLYKNFNGNVYVNNDCLIFYKIFDIKDGINEIYKKYDGPSDENGNLIFIVFATFNEGKIDIGRVIEKELENKIEKISFSREGKFKIYNLKKFSLKFFKLLN